MDVARPDMPSDEVLALIQSAQADLARAGEGGPLRRDPYRNVLIGLSATLSVFGRSIGRWERAVADVIAARDPLPEADRVALKADLVAATEDGAYRGMRKEAQRMVRALDRRLVVLIGLWVGGAYVVGVASVIANFRTVAYMTAAKPQKTAGCRSRRRFVVLKIAAPLTGFWS
jgi:hypothetical protein